jgi:hypothetical protein
MNHRNLHCSALRGLRYLRLDVRLAFPPQSNVGFINSKNCSGFAVSLLLCALNNFMFELCRI